MTGSTVQHYQVGELIGRGGMGEVYVAEDTRLKRRVALKFLSELHQADPERRARLVTEAQAASALGSDNIADIYEVGEHDGRVFIAMEYIKGELLSARVERGPLPIDEALDFGAQVADALDEAHKKGIVHRDIKSSNMIITERGVIKILDFGLAKFTKKAEEQLAQTLTHRPETMTGVVQGTLSYMAPEQALGHAVDHRADIFSLGVVLYEMLTGRLPFQGESLTQIVDQIVHDDPPSVTRLNRQVAPELETVVRKALEKNPEFRYQTARDLFIDLHNLRRQSGRNGVLPATESQTGSSTAAAPASAGAGTSAAAGEELANAVAVTTFVNITRDSEDEWIGTGITETVTADLQTRRDWSVVAREQVLDALVELGQRDPSQSDESFAMQIGRKLRASWIVSGGYQRVGDTLRITARLIDVKSGALLNTVKLDGPVEEIFSLQDRIAPRLTADLGADALATSREGT